MQIPYNLLEKAETCYLRIDKELQSKRSYNGFIKKIPTSTEIYVCLCLLWSKGMLSTT